MSTTIDQLSVVDLASKIRSGELTCLQVAKKYCENIAATRHLNALTYFEEERSLREATRLDQELREKGTSGVGKLHGVPLVIKDMIHDKDMPCTCACPALEEFRPSEDAPLIKSLKQAGALILARANMHELASGVTSKNVYYGSVRCPLNPAYSAGGSSGGTGAAIGARQAPAGLGTDTGGSIRIPSSINGLCGLRPTLGRYSQTGVLPLSTTNDTPGPMANSCGDLELIDEVITGETSDGIQLPETLSGLKIGIPKGFHCANLHPEIERIFERTKQLLAKHGCTLVHDIDMHRIEELSQHLGVAFVGYQSRSLLRKYLVDNQIPLSLEELTAKILSPDAKELFETFVLETGRGSISRETFDECRHVKLPQLVDEYRRIFERVDLLAFPAMSCLPPLVDQDEDTSDGGETMRAMVRNTNPSSCTGIPGLSVPMGVLPPPFSISIGLLLESAHSRDKFLLRCGSLIHNILKNNI